MNIITGKIIYSLNISNQIADFLDTKKKSISIKSLSLANNKLLIILNNSYLVTFNKNGLWIKETFNDDKFILSKKNGYTINEQKKSD